ncbi:hypothetical protein [Mangrovimonas cancribranchiae]|uniref:Lipoprotein n=1 Tax=Mangrovimonas cancribranchiae TaxID=3080055 RepID=A0AAU6P3G3_9FLAO
MRLFTIIIIFILVSCGGVNSHRQTISAKSLKNSACPNLKIEYHKSEASNSNNVTKIDLLPIFFDTSLKNPDNIKEITNKLTLRKKLETIVFNILEKHNIDYTPHSFNTINSQDVVNYKKSVRKSSFALAHDEYNEYISKEYYSSAIDNIGSEPYKLAFFFQFFPKQGKTYERIYINILLYNTEKNENVYYDYLIYEQCSIKNLDVFKSVLDELVLNFKIKNSSKNSE